MQPNCVYCVSVCLCAGCRIGKYIFESESDSDRHLWVWVGQWLKSLSLSRAVPDIGTHWLISYMKYKFTLYVCVCVYVFMRYLLGLHMYDRGVGTRRWISSMRYKCTMYVCACIIIDEIQFYYVCINKYVYIYARCTNLGFMFFAVQTDNNKWIRSTPSVCGNQAACLHDFYHNLLHICIHAVLLYYIHVCVCMYNLSAAIKRRAVYTCVYVYVIYTYTYIYIYIYIQARTNNLFRIYARIFKRMWGCTRHETGVEENSLQNSQAYLQAISRRSATVHKPHLPTHTHTHTGA